MSAFPLSSKTQKSCGMEAWATKAAQLFMLLGY
jgi:hypothetical protein